MNSLHPRAVLNEGLVPFQAQLPERETNESSRSAPNSETRGHKKRQGAKEGDEMKEAINVWPLTLRSTKHTSLRPPVVVGLSRRSRELAEPRGFDPRSNGCDPRRAGGSRVEGSVGGCLRTDGRAAASIPRHSMYAIYAYIGVV